MTLFEVVHKRKLYLYKNNIECKDAGFITEIIKKIYLFILYNLLLIC